MMLFQNPMSGPCRRVLATMYQLGSPVELKSVDFQSGELESAEFRRMNPNGAIPLLKDGDFHLSESCAIMQYLAEKKGNTELWPQDTKCRADIARWNFWGMAHFGPACDTYLWENMLKKMLKMGAPDAGALKTAEEDFRRYGQVLNEQLAKNQYVTGKTLTLADFTLASMVAYADASGLPWGQFPHIKSWYARMETLDAWKKSAPRP